MVPPRGFLVLLTLLVSALVVEGCAKRPATTQASAPAPTGASGTTTGTGAPPTVSSATPVQPSTQTPTGSPAPPTTTPRVTDFVANPNLRDVFFDFDKYDIRPEDAKTLDANASWLKSNPNHLVLIEGHCDERGTNEYNLALGERRAKSAMNYLVSQGVQATRITIISYGEERPVCAQKTDGCWARNRRAHFLVKQR